MFDLQLIREHKDEAAAGLKKKNFKADLDLIAAKDERRRKLQQQADELRAQQNAANDEIASLMKEKKDAKKKMGEMKAISGQIDEFEVQLKGLKSEIDALLIGIPNVPHASVPVGGPEKNSIVRSWGTAPKFDFKPKTHLELAEGLDIVDFKRGTKISGSNFILYKGLGARLIRALVNFMLDVHTGEHGYKEMFTPVLVNRESMTGTGQLPKMEDDMYRLKDEDLFLIPTAEVPVTNIHRDEILKEEELPIYYTAYSACFRREAGSYGKDTKGLMRIHQFDKVELVKFVRPESSYDELEKLVGNAEVIFQRLNIPYRVSLLASGDLSFAAAKCYDLEVYAAGMEKWLEASSCSNFEAFQARRANIRYKGASTKKPTPVHTLNGSGVALPRTMIALLENNQTKAGEIVIPAALRPYMGGLERIKK